MVVIKYMAAFVCLILLSACSKPVPKELPDDWPIPELTLPEGAELAGPVFKPQDMAQTSLGDSWIAYFNCSLSYVDAAKHVESCLGEVGYKRLIIGDVGQQLGDDFMRDYYSSDGLIHIMLSNGVDPEIVKNKKLSADYHLTITLLSEPDGLFQMAGKTDKLTLLDLK